MANEAHPLDLERHLQLRKALSTVSSSSIWTIWNNAPTGKKFAAVLNFLKLRIGTGKLSSNEFLDFGFCDGLHSLNEMKCFAGKRAQQAFNKIYNDNTWYAATKHKLLFDTTMKGAGLPVPAMQAIYDRKGRGAGYPLLTDLDQLKSYLSDASNHPVFCKPTTGLLSIGAFRIDGKDGDKLLINGSHAYAVEEVVNYISKLSPKGYLFQSVLKPHPDFQPLTGDAIASARFVILNFEGHAEIHSCILKLPAKGEVADNFWRPGSVLCNVDPQSGEIIRCVCKNEDGINTISEHPVSGFKMMGYQLPDFSNASETVLRAARFLAGIKVQSWDVAFSDKGPILLEVNFGGDLNLSQLASGQGIMDSSFCRILRQSGFKGRLPNG